MDWSRSSQTSQSLLLFRAFQRDKYLGGGFIREIVAIPSFIQGISTGGSMMKDIKERLSQSLLLFRAFQPSLWEERKTGSGRRRNPFFYSGHFNNAEGDCWGRRSWGGRNPFFYSGHFNYPRYRGYSPNSSQSLLLFRAFQPLREYLRLQTLLGGSQSLLLFRAFQQDQKFLDSPKMG